MAKSAKSLISIIISILLVFSAFNCFAEVEVISDSYFNYIPNDDGTACLDSIIDDELEFIRIPGNIQGLRVVSVAQQGPN